MKIRLLFTAVSFIALMIFAAAPIGAQDATPQTSASSPLLDMLRFVPDTAEYRQFITYGDQAAWYRGWGFDSIPDLATWSSLHGSGSEVAFAWLANMGRQTNVPYYYGLEGFPSTDSRSFYGFDIFDAQHYLEAFDPNGVINVTDTNTDPTQVGNALVSSGYTADVLNGANLYSLGQDNLAPQNMTIPQVGRTAMLNRIALTGQWLLATRNTAAIESALQTYGGDQPSLAENPEYQAAIEGLNDPTLADAGELVGIVVIDASLLQTSLCAVPVPDQEKCRHNAQDAAANPLPAFDFVVLATRQTQGRTTSILEIVFSQGTNPNAAAEALVGRIHNYESLSPSVQENFRSWQNNLDLAVGKDVAGFPVALISFHQADPTFQNGNWEPQEPQLFAWSDMVISRDLLFLVNNIQPA